MKISEAELRAYTNEITKSQEGARIYVEASLRAYLQLNPGATWQDLNDFALQIMEQAYRAYGDMAASKASAKYDEITSKLGYNVTAANNDNSWDESFLASEVAYASNRLLNGSFSIDQFINNLAARAYDHALHAANNTMSSNANRDEDFKAGMRWARVPTGRETCGFCVMLASRGFAYRTRESAGGIYGSSINTYHSHCDCRVVPGDAFTEVEGYDPDWLYDVYKDARDTIEKQARYEWSNMSEEQQNAYKSKGHGAYDKFLRNKTIAEINRRNKEWVYDKKSGKVTVEEFATPDDYEMSSAEIISNHGYDVEFKARSLDYKKRIADTVINGVKVEFKNPCGNGYLTVYNQFKSTVFGENKHERNPQASVIAISNLRSEMSVEKIINDSISVFESNEFPEIKEIIAVDKNGNIARINKKQS